ncbi:hypothetical protein [Celerinatantimonas sp. YJH-8]|uniref:hypothetical protein n=1 Tax=Celerinatantimonas sp. YJH-8 TaxID=3228714 RepID=UPI0038C9BD50
MTIKCYENNVFTHDGQSDVANFITEIEQYGELKTALEATENFTVYSGFHGYGYNDTMGPQGSFKEAFSEAENTQVSNAAKAMEEKYPVKIEVEIISSKDELKNLNISELISNGNVFFTWCDSDAYIKGLMGKDMPAKA